MMGKIIDLVEKYYTEILLVTLAVSIVIEAVYRNSR